MNIRKFGAHVSKLRKQNDLTQLQLAEMLNVTRQAVSKWEMGDSYPDISLLSQLAYIFGITVDQLITYGKPCIAENKNMIEIANGTPGKVANMLQDKDIVTDSLINVDPMTKASALENISEGLKRHGIDIGHILELATYMNETDQTSLKKIDSLEQLDESLLRKFIPFLNRESKELIFCKIIDGELDSSLLAIMVPHMEMPNLGNLIDAAVLEGQIDACILKVLR